MSKDEVPQCLGCKYYHGDCTCEAFPGTIPLRILTNEIDHKNPYKGDHGVRYERI